MNTTTKTFEEINSINVNKYVEKKENGKDKNGKTRYLSYLSWSYAWAEIKKIDPKANYVIHENADGNPFFESKFGIDCKVSVTVNDVTHTMRLPVMDGANNAMKSESYKFTLKSGFEKVVEAADAMDINKTIMRCLVKAIAMHGLGLYIYAGEDLPETSDDKTIVPTEIANENKNATVEEKQISKYNFTWVVEGNSFPIREELKKRDFRFDKESKVWYIESNDDELVLDLDLRGCKLVRLENEV